MVNRLQDDFGGSARRRRMVLIFLGFGLLFGAVSPAGAGVFGKALGGAMQGAVMGNLLGGRNGARQGAAIGAGIGVLSGISEDAQRRNAQKAAEERYARQMAEMELRRQQQEQEHFESASRSFKDGVPSNLASIGTLQPHEDTRLITEIQKSLVRLDFDPGAVDGELSNATVRAIQAYQSRHNLLETGQPSQELLKHMIRNGG